MRILTIGLVIVSLGLAACSEEDLPQNPLEDGLFGGNIFDMGLFGSGGGGIINPDIPQVLIDESNTTQTVTRDDRYDLTVSGSENDITIAPNSEIRNMLVSGDRNVIEFESGTTVEDLDITGRNNVVRVPDGSGIVIDNDSGSDNSFEVI